MSRAPKRQLADRTAEGGCRWPADGHAAGALGDTAKAEHCYAKSQFWKDRYNLLTGSGDRPAPKA